MVDAHPLGQIVGVAVHLVERGLRDDAAVLAQHRRPEADADDAAARRHRVELLVRQVARGRAEGVGVRVGGDERRAREAGDVPEAALVQVREVDEQAELVARAARAARRRASGRGRCPERTGKRNGTPSAKAFGRLQTSPIERRPRSTSGSRPRRSGSIGSAPSRCRIAASVSPSNCSLDVRERPRYPHGSAGRGLEREQQLDELLRLARRLPLVDRRRQLELVVTRRRRALHHPGGDGVADEHREEPPGEAARLCPRQVEVTALGALEEAGHAFPAQPQQDVVVPVEDRDRRQCGSEGSSEYMTKSLRRPSRALLRAERSVPSST